MADPIDLITANPDSDNPSNFAAEADLAWVQLKGVIPQINNAAKAMSLNSVSDTSVTENVIGNGSKTFTVSAGKSFLKGQILNIADSLDPANNFMTAVCTDYVDTALFVTVLQFFGSGTKTDWVISLSAPPAIPTVTSEIKVMNFAGRGSTNTKTHRFTTIDINTATADIAYEASAALGDKFTILTNGWYRIRGQVIGSASPSPGVTINCTQLSNEVTNLANINQLLTRYALFTSSVSGYIDTVVYLKINDVIRVQDGTGTLTIGDNNTYFLIQKVSLQGVGGTGGGGGGGAPIDADYLVVTANGTLTNERVIETSNTIVVDTATAGKVQLKRQAVTGDVNIPANGNSATIPLDTVNNAMLFNMPSNTVKLNNAATDGDPVDLLIPPSTILGRDSTGNIIPVGMGTNMSISGGLLNSAGGGGGGAPTTAQYIVAATDATLTAERVGTNSTTNTWNFGVAGQAAIERAALTGDVTAPANSNVTTITAGSVTNAKLANATSHSIKVNNTGAAAPPVDLIIPLSRLVGRGDSGSIAAISLGPNMSLVGTVLDSVGGLDLGDLTSMGVVTFDGTNFKDATGTNIILGTNGIYTWAAKPAASSVPVGTHIMIDPSSFGGTHKYNVGPTAVSDGTNWKPAGGRQLIMRASGSNSVPIATGSGTSATLFNIATNFSMPANFFTYAGGGLHIKAKFRKTDADANSSVFTVRWGEFNGTGSEIVTTLTATGAGREAKIDTTARVTVTGASGVAEFNTDSIPSNSTATTLIIDRLGNFNTTAISYLVATVACSANAAATHSLVSFEAWWVA